MSTLIICLKLFYVFFKVGLFAFGGGYVILPMIYQEIQIFNFMPADEFSNIVAISQMTPGPIAVNAATYVGYEAGGIWGSIFATIGVSLPSFILVLLVMAFLNRFKTSKALQATLSGVRPATVGLMATAVLFFAKTSIVSEKFFSLAMFKSPLNYISIGGIIIFIITLLLSQKYKVGPIVLTILGGIIGVIIL